MLLLLAVAFTTHFPLTHATSKLLVGRTHANVVYAISNHVVYRSDDGGATFARRSRLTNESTLAIDPTNDDVLYALSRQPASLQRSRDGGATWFDRTVPRYAAPVALIVDSRNPSRLILAGDCPARPQQTDSGVWVSDDGGDNWKQQSNDCVNGIVLDSEGKLYINAAYQFTPLQPSGDLVVDPHAPLVRYAISTSGVIVSYDGGATWQRFGMEGMSAIPSSLAIDPVSGRLFAGTPLGVFMSENGIPFWRPMPGAPVWSNVAVAGTTLFIDSPTGAYRAPLPAMAPLTPLGGLPGVPAEVRALAADPRRPLLYASAFVFDLDSGAWRGGLWRSGDRGASWNVVSSGWADRLTVDGNGDVYGPGFRYIAVAGLTETWWPTLSAPSQYVADPKRHGWLYAVSDRGLYESSDGGQVWHRLLMGEVINGIEMADDGRLYVAAQKGLFVSGDAGATWTRIAPSFTNAIAVAGSTLYRDYSQYSIDRSDDGGATWHYLRKPTDYLLDQLVIDPRDDRSVWIVAKDGTFHSADGGATWERIGFLKAIVFDADGMAMHVIGESYSEVPGEWDAVLRAERRRSARK